MSAIRIPSVISKNVSSGCAIMSRHITVENRLRKIATANARIRISVLCGGMVSR